MRNYIIYIAITIFSLICLASSKIPQKEPNVFYVGTLDSVAMHNSRVTKFYTDSSWIYLYGTPLNFEYKDSLFIFTASNGVYLKLFITNNEALVAYQILKIDKPTQ